MVLVEVSRKPYLASIVPVIVNAILNEHQIIVDIVAFVNKGDFPRSRLGEKQRGKILAGWVTRKMRTLAQFAIRDVDPAAIGDGEGGEQNRASSVSGKSQGLATIGSSSLRNAEPAPRILEQEEFEKQMDHIANMVPAAQPMSWKGQEALFDNAPGQQESESSSTAVASSNHQAPPPQGFGREGHNAPDNQPPAPALLSGGGQSGPGAALPAPQLKLPSVDGRESMMWHDDNADDDWTADAIMHMNLTGDMNQS